MKKLSLYTLYLLFVWGAVRYFFDFPSVIEELWFKPVIWLVPLFWWNVFLKKRVKVFGDNNWTGVFAGVLLGGFYFLIVKRFVLPNSLSFDLLGVAMATAVVEEMVFSGFGLGYLLDRKVTANMAILAISMMTMICRLPILFFDYGLNWETVIPVCIFVFSIAMLNGFLRVRTGGLIGVLVARVFLNISLLV